MSQEQSNVEDSVVETEDGPVDDETAETEVNFLLPRGSDRTRCRRMLHSKVRRIGAGSCRVPGHSR